MVVQLVDGSIDALAGPEFDDSFAASVAMSIAEGDFAHFAHEVLQILPRDLRRKILHDDAVLRPKRWRTAVAWWRSAAEARMAVVATFSAAATTAAAAAAVAAVAAWTFGELDPNAFAVETLSVEVLDGVFGVANVLEFHEAKTSLKDDVAEAPVSLEETLQVRLASTGRQSSDEQTCAHRV